METINTFVLNEFTEEQLKNVLVFNLETNELQKGDLFVIADYCNMTNASDNIFGFEKDAIAKIVITNNDITIFVYQWYEIPF